jgi:PAS domain S-box-containing protein
MSDDRKSKRQLIEELSRLRQQLTELNLDIAETRRLEGALAEAQRRLQLLGNLIVDLQLGTSLAQSIDHSLQQLSLSFPDLRVAYLSISDNGTGLVTQAIEPAGMPNLTGASVDLSPASTIWSLCADTSRDDRLDLLADILAAGGVKAMLHIPVAHADRLLGILGLDSPKPRLWRDQEIETLTKAAASLARVSQEVSLHHELQQAQKALVISEERYELAVTAGRIGVWAWNLQTDELYLAPNLKAMLGYDEHKVRNHLDDWKQLVHPDDLEPVMAVLETQRTGHTHEFEIEHRKMHRDGTVCWFLTRGTVMRGATGIPVYVMGTDTDITEWKQAEAELRESEKQNRQQRRLAAIGQLAAGITHDFNNILTSIIGFAEILCLDLHLSLTAKQDLGQIIGQSERAARLIRQILDFSRSSAITRQPIDLKALLQETLSLLTRTLPATIRLTLDIPAGEAQYIINTDSAQIQQAITNLVINARDAMPDGGELRLGLAQFTLRPSKRAPFPEMSPGNWLSLSVSDTGAGISAEHLAHIFEPFFTTKEPGQGTGLGLAQVYRIVKQHGGDIEVESQVGVGTTFTIYFPALSSLRYRSSDTATRVTHRGHDQLILVVEDEPTVRTVTQSMLERLGYQVLTAPDGQQAITIYEQHAPEIALVLTDLTMPELGGIDLAIALRDRDPALQVVMMTGDLSEGQNRAMRDQGITVWLQKPVSLEQLAQTIGRLLQN